MHEESDPIVVGLIAAPGAPARVAAQVRDELAGDLARRYRERLLAEDWDFAI